MVASDLAAPDGPHNLAGQVRQIVGGRLDVLAANAGVSKSAAIEDTTVEDFDRLFAVNVRAPLFLVQQTLPMMGSSGSIVFVSSLAAHAVVGTRAAYAATKRAIDTLVKHFAALGPRGIRVNAVAPGVVDSDMSNFTKTDEGQQYALSMQAMQRLAKPRDIGPIVAFLASGDARWNNPSRWSRIRFVGKLYVRMFSSNERFTKSLLSGSFLTATSIFKFETRPRCSVGGIR